MRFTIGIASLCLACAGCSAPSEDTAATGNAAESEAGDASGKTGDTGADDAATAEADYDVPEATQGLEWFLSEGPAGPSSAVYGPPNAGGIVLLGCNGDSVEVVLQDAMGHDGREVATVKSGPLSGEFDTTFQEEGMALLIFDIPASDPVLKRFGDDGFYITFANGENNAFPPSEEVSRALSGCVK